MTSAVVPLALAEMDAVLAGGADKPRSRPPLEDMPAPTVDQLDALVCENVLAAARHVTRWEVGDTIDADSGRHALVHAAARLLLAAQAELRWTPK